MTDLDAVEYIEELKEFNSQGKMTTPKNESLGFDTIYQCAFDHAVRALKERLGKEDQEDCGGKGEYGV